MAARIGFSWLKYFDYLMRNNPKALHGAAGTFFIGRQVEKSVGSVALVGGN